MNLRQLEVFYAIMKQGSISSAARSLCVSQPNVTRVLSHTEQQLGFPLFERVKGRLITTKEAKLLLPEAETIHEQLGQFKNLVNKIRSGEKHLSIGAPPVLASEMLAGIIAHASKSQDLTIELCTGNRDELCHALLKNEMDFAICFGTESLPGICHQTLIDTKLSVIKPLNSDDVESTSLEAVIKRSPSLIGLDSRDPVGLILDQAINTIEANFHPQIIVRSYSAAAELVCLGAGTAVVDPWTAQQYRHRTKRMTLKPAIDLSVSVLHAEHRPLSITCKWFIEQIINAQPSIFSGHNP
ncbi:LysR family transcriptional regulator [Vibrio caribbeanicus]|uniref:LysR family transcriptional regulator n=1 Tax=Vibrio caribbeanicus TaxID=701175 RepID=UPI0030D76453